MALPSYAIPMSTVTLSRRPEWDDAAQCKKGQVATFTFTSLINNCLLCWLVMHAAVLRNMLGRQELKES